VISAVGHEIDFTISDFVADARGATPSAAAEIITEGAFSSRAFVADSAQYLGKLVRQRLGQEEDAARQLAQRLARVHPRPLLNEQLQLLDDLQTSLVRCVRSGLRQQRTAWRTVQERLFRLKPSLLLLPRRQSLRDLRRRLREHTLRQGKEMRNVLAGFESRLRLLSTENALARGYSITMDARSGRIIRAAGAVRAGQRLRTKLKSGEITSVAQK